MQNGEMVLATLQKALDAAKSGQGGSVAIIGESGIGKSHLARDFVRKNAADTFVIEVRGLPTVQPALSSAYEALYRAISSGAVKKEAYVALLRTYTRLLPGFGQYLAPLMGDWQRQAMRDVIARSGMNFGVSPAVHIMKLVDEISRGKTLLLVCDDVQWVDDESWRVLMHVVANARTSKWCVVLLYNDRVETWGEPQHAQIGKAFAHWSAHQQEVGWEILRAERWGVQTLPTLCERVLGGGCGFSANQLSELHTYTSGVPLFVESVLHVLKERGIIEYQGGVWVSKKRWDDLDIRAELRDSIVERLKRIYTSVPGSRPFLEVASVAGETFRDEMVDGVLGSQSGYQLFCELERRFQIVQYLFEGRYWAFEHNVIRESIYRSLGKHAACMHLQLARVLDSVRQLDASPLTIAFHYEQGGDFASARRHRLAEVERLLRNGLFESAIALLDNVAAAQSEWPLTQSDSVEAMALLYGKLYFHLSRYKDAISRFEQLLAQPQTDAGKATYHRWLGRCLLKLDRPEDFQQSIYHLKQALPLYEALGDVSGAGHTWTDMVVAYAHLNHFAEAERSYSTAEDCFNRTKDTLGMARLQRRCVIFMESELAAPILERLAQTFRDFGILHEVVMALNNASTERMYLSQYDQAERLLCEAVPLSADLGDFGASYLYCNLAIVNTITSRFERARECIGRARQRSMRSVEELILDLNEAVLFTQTHGAAVAERAFRSVLRRAESTAEGAYIDPVKLNLASCLLQQRRPVEALSILATMALSKKSVYSSYTNARWARLARACVQQSPSNPRPAQLSEVESWCEAAPRGPYYDYEFAFIDMQFWSD